MVLRMSQRVTSRVTNSTMAEASLGRDVADKAETQRVRED